MPFIQQQVVVLANTTNNNVLAGAANEFLTTDSIVELGLVASAAGLVADVYSGSDVLALNLALSVQNRVPVYPDDFTLQDEALAGDRLIVRVTNTTAGNLTLFYSVKMTPVDTEE